MGGISDYPELSVPLRKRVSLKSAQSDTATTTTTTTDKTPPLNSRKRTLPEPEDDFTGLPPLPPSISDYPPLSPLEVEPIQTLLPVTAYSDQLSSGDNFSEGLAKDWGSLFNKYASMGDASVNMSYDLRSPIPDAPPVDSRSPQLVNQNDDVSAVRKDIQVYRRRKSRQVVKTYEHKPMLMPTSPSAKLVGAGVSNLGNTCFMSVILQCFTHTVPLVTGLRSYNHMSPCGDVAGFCVICAFREHFDAALSPCRSAVNPLKLANNVSYFSSSFQKARQEDAHEFMQCCLDKLQRCFPYEDNLVEKLFGGRLLSNLRCCSCGHSSKTYEPVIDISLEIEDVYTVQHALESFTKVENMDGKFTCNNCNQEVFKEKQLMLDQTPSIAAFHLKRFKSEGTGLKKIDTHIFFTTDIDLHPYTSSNGSDNNTILKYELYGVVQHSGSTPTSGHYYCFIRSAPDQWHKMDDSEVIRVTEDEVLNQEAYILFYKREGVPWFSNMNEQFEEKPTNEDQRIDLISFVEKKT